MCAGNARLVEHVRQADLGVEQHGRDVGRESAHEIELESAERLAVEREAGVLPRGHQLGALVGGEDPEAAPRRGELVERAPLRDREHSCSFVSDLKHFRA